MSEDQRTAAWYAQRARDEEREAWRDLYAGRLGAFTATRNALGARFEWMMCVMSLLLWWKS